MTSDAQLTVQHAALFDTCVREAASSGRALMEMMVGKLRLLLQQQTGIARVQERDALAESLKSLGTHETLLCDRYPAALLAAFSEDISGQKVKPTVAPLSFDQLELMDEAQVQESVELARALQAALLATDSQLTELNALICAAQGLTTVQAHRNPVRPEVYVRALRTVLAQTEVPPLIWLNWMQHMGATLGKELVAVYSSLCDLLRSNGVTQAAYTVTQTADASRPAAAGSRDAAMLTLNQLRRLLAGELDPDENSFAARFARQFESSGKEPPPSFAHTVPAAFEALQEMKQVDQVMQRLAKRISDSAPAELPAAQTTAAVHQQLRRDARGVGQALGVEVVGLMVDNIAQDPRLLPPVQQAVRDLETALLRLALIDPRFFSHKQHPARRLLEQMTHRSLAFRSVDAAGFNAFLQPLREAVDALSSVAIESAEPFDFALKSLEAVWDRQEKQERKQREMAMQALVHAEQRHLLAQDIAKDMRSRPEAAGAPAPVMTFLCGPWAQVVAETRLGDKSEAVDPGGHLAVAKDLLWSTQTGLVQKNAAKLTGMIAPLLGKLREGLKSIDYPAAQADVFFDHLMGFHQQALKPASGIQAPAPAKTQAREKLEAMFRDADEAGLWLAPSEAQQSGFLDAADSLGSKSHFESTQSVSVPADASHAGAKGPVAETGQAAISLGTWVELQVHGRWTRMQLTWASPHGNLFMFTGGKGSTHSMTRHSLDQLLADGAMRVIADQAVVDSALDAVAQTAMRNSVDITL